MSVQRATSDRTAADAAGSKGAITILLVEDEDSVRRLITRFLTFNAYRVLTAESGRGALSLWEQHRDEIDLLLTDVILPDEPGGRVLADRFQAEQPELKVIYTSGYALGFSDGEKCFAPEINFLHKPYRPEQLLAAVRKALESHPRPTTVC